MTAALLVAVLVAAGTAAVRTRPSTAGAAAALTHLFARGSASPGTGDNKYPTSLASVTQQTLSSQTKVNATLGYAGSYTIVNQAKGTITALPAVGQVINQGEVLYKVDGKPVVLLYGSTPAYRDLADGASGADVKDLNADLVALGYCTSDQLDPSSDKFNWCTKAALKKLQKALGVDQTGSLTLGQAVFLPSAVRITSTSATLGGAAGPGSPMMQASSTTRVVSINLSAAQQTQLKVGDKVTVTLPNNKTTPGVVSSIGTVASTPAAGSTDAPTIPVEVTLTDAAATGSLDKAPVQVSITTASVDNALVVPVNALLSLASGGYAIEVVGRRGVHHLVPVTLGLFDDAAGLVQVTGSGLAAGQSVVVPAA